MSQIRNSPPSPPTVPSVTTAGVARPAPPAISGGSAKTLAITPAPPSRTTPNPAPLQRQNTPSAPPARANIEGKPIRIEAAHRAIEEAAYFLWLERGGDEVLNWLEAERTVRAGAKSATQ